GFRPIHQAVSTDQRFREGLFNMASKLDKGLMNGFPQPLHLDRSGDGIDGSQSVRFKPLPPGIEQGAFRSELQAAAIPLAGDDDRLAGQKLVPQKGLVEPDHGDGETVDHQFSAEAGLFPAVPANARLPEHLPPDGDPLPVAGPFQVGQPVVIVPKGKIGQKILHRFNPQPVQIFRPLFPHAGHLGDGDFRQLHSFVGVPKILRSSARPVGVAASPPKAVSFSDTGISRPIRYIASITSSVGITLRTRARAMSAATMAMAAPIALRLTQGASTNVATGSHTRPSMFFQAMATASADMEGVPPAISTTA